MKGPQCATSSLGAGAELCRAGPGLGRWSVRSWPSSLWQELNPDSEFDPHEGDVMPSQFAWRYCGKCRTMFFDGYSYKGRCPVGEGHDAFGFYFHLPYDVPPSGTAQGSWRFCGKCCAMFYDGYAEKGRCQMGGGHAAQGFVFVLPHSVPPSSTAQDGWRFCNKCCVMFYDGASDKGRCAAGGGHFAQGLMFVLPHMVWLDGSAFESETEVA